MIVHLLAAGHLLSGVPNPFLWLDEVHAKRLAAQDYRHRTRVEKKVYQADGWEITVQTDGFTGQVRCRIYSPKTLSQGRISFAKNVLGFEMGLHKNTYAAWYSLDKGTARPVQSLYPRLIAANVAIDGYNLENPSEGVVLIPVEDLTSIQTVEIRLNEGQKPKTFKLRGFTTTFKTAQRLGCTGVDSFERAPW